MGNLNRNTCSDFVCFLFGPGKFAVKTKGLTSRWRLWCLVLPPPAEGSSFTMSSDLSVCVKVRNNSTPPCVERVGPFSCGSWGLVWFQRFPKSSCH